MRADLVTARTAIALAAWHGRDVVTEEDIRIAARLALPHRRRRDPFDAPGLDEQALDDALREAAPHDPDGPQDPDDDPESRPRGPDPGGPGGPSGPATSASPGPSAPEPQRSRGPRPDDPKTPTTTPAVPAALGLATEPVTPRRARSRQPRRAHPYPRRPRSAPAC